jgi:hypothetical protein
VDVALLLVRAMLLALLAPPPQHEAGCAHTRLH